MKDVKITKHEYAQLERLGTKCLHLAARAQQHDDLHVLARSIASEANQLLGALERLEAATPGKPKREKQTRSQASKALYAARCEALVCALWNYIDAFPKVWNEDGMWDFAPEQRFGWMNARDICALIGVKLNGYVWPAARDVLTHELCLDFRTKVRGPKGRYIQKAWCFPIAQTHVGRWIDKDTKLYPIV